MQNPSVPAGVRDRSVRPVGPEQFVLSLKTGDFELMVKHFRYPTLSLLWTPAVSHKRHT